MPLGYMKVGMGLKKKLIFKGDISCFRVGQITVIPLYM